MSKKAAAAPAVLTVDPTSAAIALAYTGAGRFAADAPARHLTEADLARLAYRRAAAVTFADGIRPDPLNPDPGIVAQLVAELTLRGLYSADPAAIAAAEAEDAPVTPEPPAEPAPTTED